MIRARRTASVWGAMAAILMIAAGGLFAQPTAPAGDASRAAVIVIDGVIDAHTHDTLVRRFRDARAAGAQIVILKLNTPGGLVSPALDISSFIRSQSDVHTIAFVQNRALSAGIMIGLSCDELAMAPGSLIGDSAPIAISPTGGLETLGQTERA